jgi:glycosyltransferase involved in cell wall biosynthesis
VDIRRQPLAYDPLADDRDGDDPWAHASAWAMLSGKHRRLSCIVSCFDQVRRVADLLPRLSDVLTECGYPWEIIVVDRCSQDSTADIAQAWTELPGFRYLRVASNGVDGRDIEAGLLAARGDAVLLVDPALPSSQMQAIRRLVLAWEDSAVAVHLGDDGPDGPLTAWSEALWRHGALAEGWSLPPGCLRLGLLDRQVVDWIVAG